MNETTIRRLVAFLNDRINQCIYCVLTGHSSDDARKHSKTDAESLRELITRGERQ